MEEKEEARWSETPRDTSQIDESVAEKRPRTERSKSEMNTEDGGEAS